jgi:hypothetical protein
MSECRGPGRSSTTLYAVLFDSPDWRSGGRLLAGVAESCSVCLVTVIVMNGLYGYLSASPRTWVEG